MASPSPPASSPTRQPSTRSPSASMSNNTYTSTTSSTPSKQHHHHQHHGHLPVGHSIHSPAHSATGEAIQGRPSEAGGLHTSTSRGNILVPPPSSSTSNTPADLLSVISSTTSNPSLASSRPSSPAVLSTPNSPVLQLRSSSSRPTSPCRSPNNTKQDFDTMSNSTTPQLDSSAIFERDAEFATEHLLTGSEAIDLAAAPILSEVALAVISNDPSPASSAILGGGGVTENMTQSLDSTLFSSPSAKLPSNAIIPGNNDSYNHQGNLISNNEPSTSNIPLSERLRHSSPSPARGPSARGTYTTSTSEGTGEGEFSPPPSLSLSPSATGSPISSTPGSPIQPLHYPSSSLIGTGGDGAGGNAVNTTSTSGPFGHNLNDGGAPVMGLDVGDASSTSAFITSGNALPSPPASAISGISLSGNKDSGKRRLSMISYADIINSERLSDTHSGFSSPTPSSALSLSAAALPVQSSSSAGLSPAVSPGLTGLGAGGTGTAGGLGSALYSPFTSPEGEGALSPSVVSDDANARDGATSGSPFEKQQQQQDAVTSILGYKPPANNRTDTASSIATERYVMPGQIPLQTPPITQSNQTEDKDVTPTNSKIKKDQREEEVSANNGLKESTSSSSWSMLEMGKALVGNAAGAVGSVLGVSGIGTELEEDEEDINKGHKDGKIGN